MSYQEEGLGGLLASELLEINGLTSDLSEEGQYRLEKLKIEDLMLFPVIQ